jgi:hypothetical protein
MRRRMSKSARAATDADDDDALEVGPRYGFSPKQIQEFKAVFNEFDVNGQPTQRAKASARLLTLVLGTRRRPCGCG